MRVSNIKQPTEEPRATARKDIRQQRFLSYFPRVFAYALGTTRDEDTAKQVTVAAFARAFSLPDMREHEFEVEIFRSARESGRAPVSRERQSSDGLTPREREVLSLVFDAQLSRDQVARLLSLRPETVLGVLLKGLRKMRDPIPSPRVHTMPGFA